MDVADGGVFNVEVDDSQSRRGVGFDIVDGHVLKGQPVEWRRERETLEACNHETNKKIRQAKMVEGYLNVCRLIDIAVAWLTAADIWRGSRPSLILLTRSRASPISSITAIVVVHERKWPAVLNC